PTPWWAHGLYPGDEGIGPVPAPHRRSVDGELRGIDRRHVDDVDIACRRMKPHQETGVEAAEPEVPIASGPRERGSGERKLDCPPLARLGIELRDDVARRVVTSGRFGYPERPTPIRKSAVEVVSGRRHGPRRRELERGRVDPNDVRGLRGGWEAGR